jgi:hypothetical protein
MPPPEKDDAQMALALQQRECGLHVNGPVLQLDGMKMLARELEKIQKQRTDNDAKLAQQLHDKLNGHGGVVASGHRGVVASGHRGVVASGIGRADAMTDSEFRDWLASGSGSYESRTYAERLEALKRMPL